jgi:hypothetical protein
MSILLQREKRAPLDFSMVDVNTTWLGTGIDSSVNRTHFK